MFISGWTGAQASPFSPPPPRPSDAYHISHAETRRAYPKDGAQYLIIGSSLRCPTRGFCIISHLVSPDWIRGSFVGERQPAPLHHWNLTTLSFRHQVLAVHYSLSGQHLKFWGHSNACEPVSPTGLGAIRSGRRIIARRLACGIRIQRIVLRDKHVARFILNS
jgi:hypothetical protein